MQTTLQRGEVVWVELGDTERGEQGFPCVITSLTPINLNRSTVVVVPLASGITPREPVVVAVPSAGDYPNARIDQIRAVEKARIKETLGKLSPKDMRAVEEGLRGVLGV